MYTALGPGMWFFGDSSDFRKISSNTEAIFWPQMLCSQSWLVFWVLVWGTVPRDIFPVFLLARLLLIFVLFCFVLLAVSTDTTRRNLKSSIWWWVRPQLPPSLSRYLAPSDPPTLLISTKLGNAGAQWGIGLLTNRGESSFLPPVFLHTVLNHLPRHLQVQLRSLPDPIKYYNPAPKE